MQPRTGLGLRLPLIPTAVLKRRATVFRPYGIWHRFRRTKALPEEVEGEARRRKAERRWAGRV